MEGSVLSFLKAEWKVSDTGSAHWASSSFSNLLSMQIFHSASIDARNGEFHIPFNGEFMPDNEQIMPSEILVSIDICLPSSVVVQFFTF